MSYKPSPVEEFPMRSWSMRLFILDEDGHERPADVFTKVVYNLHPTFENPVQTFTKPPFICSNEGWGEFDIAIDCYTTEKTKLAPILQDLNFQETKYSSVHDVTFKNPSQALQERLRETGPLPNDEERPRKKGLAAAASGKKGAQKFDYEKIAEALQKLEEEDLLKVIQVINENKGPDTYIRSDVEAGEFSIDLYTMPDALTTKLWDIFAKKGLVAP
ncbi:transcription factor TFIIF complex subunit Tfg3 [Amphichorda felina]